MKKFVSLIMVFVFTLASTFSVCAEEKANKVISDEVFTDLLVNGKMTEENDGSYSFVKSENVGITRSILENEIVTKQETLTIIPVTDEGKENLEALVAEARSNYNSSKMYGSDTAGCVSAYTTVYWESGTENGKSTALLKSVSGGFTAEGSGVVISGGVTVKSQKVTFGTSGKASSGSKTQTTTKTPTTSARSFSYSAPSSWVPVFAESQVATVGATYTITLGRGTSTWNCVVTNQIGF